MKVAAQIGRSGTQTLLLIAFVLPGCTVRTRAPSLPVSAPLEAYCPYVDSQATFSPSITVSGNAQYFFRPNGNGAVTGSTKAPIRFAEVMVKDSAGTIVQCAETDASGNFTFPLQQDTGTYTVLINSRANNSKVKAYVMNNPTNNQYYSISASATTSANVSLSMTAPATGTLEGGAFNILDKIAKANEFLRTEVTSGACASFSADCSPYTVAPLAQVYWTKGFNPGTYLGSSSGASFYLKGTNELYILGGEDDDVDISDTDHFDNTIIVHEYGHFIENFYTLTDSPGGVHRPNDVLDPRLAWGEAWANFFQAAVNYPSDGSADPYYRDTEGNVDCGTPSSSCTRAFINENIENGVYDSLTDPYTPSSSPPRYGVRTDEGNFREFSITRILWDGFDSANESGDSVTTPFAEIWSVVTGETNGFFNASHRFRHVGLFHYIHEALSGRTSWTSLITREHQYANMRDFGNPLAAGTCGSVSMQAFEQTDGSLSQSDLFKDNDFYKYTQSTTGLLTVSLEYTGNSDLDLYIWKDGYTYGDTADLLGSSKNTSGTEQVSVTAPAGTYMINVMANPVAGTGTGSNYKLYINGTQYCPSL